MERDARDGTQHALSRKRRGTQPTRRQRQDLKGQEFSEHHDEAGKRELDHGRPVLERFAVEAAPALVPVDESHVEEEHEREYIFCYSDGNGCPDEAPFETPDEDVIHQCIERSANNQDIHIRAKQPLSLEISLPAFKGGVAWSAGDEDPEVETCETCGFFLGDDEREELCAEGPDDCYGDCDEPEEVQHSL